MRKRIEPLVLLCLFFSGVNPPAYPVSEELAAFAQDVVVADVYIYVTQTNVTHFKAASGWVNGSKEVSFQRKGKWVFYHMKEEAGGGYFALSSGGKFWSVDNARVSETHPCLSDEGYVIGRETRHFLGEGSPAHGYLEIHPGKGGLLRLRLTPTKIDAEYVDCRTPGCWAGTIGGGMTVGINPKLDEDGKAINGYDIANFTFDFLKREDKND